MGQRSTRQIISNHYIIKTFKFDPLTRTKGYELEEAVVNVPTKQYPRCPYLDWPLPLPVGERILSESSNTLTNSLSSRLFNSAADFCNNPSTTSFSTGMGLLIEMIRRRDITGEEVGVMSLCRAESVGGESCSSEKLSPSSLVGVSGGGE